MNYWDVYTYSRDLSIFIDLLGAYEVPVETTELANLDSQFQSLKGNFFVSVDNILFTIDKKISGTIPSDIGYLQILLSHKCEIDADVDQEIDDPISVYDFQLQIKGFDQNVKEYVSWWHLDKNPKSEPPKFTHPYYHLQFGGNAIESVDSGDIVLLSAPRLPHPPMDIFLGFHFILNNFYSSKDFHFVNELLDNTQYKEIICRAQTRMWEKYFSAFSDNTHNHFTRKNVFPLYLDVDSEG
ncbi:MAG: hypothetical protein RIE86_00025 [Imperialibacter sp.]|uniref:hypothetical protein n=1 Tax=Imperialibacter sp. TaxID=2038411 RepID=UPI0032ED4304